MRYPGDQADLSSTISPTPGAPAVLTRTAAGLASARFVKNAPGRPETDKLDAVCLAKLTERAAAALVCAARGDLSAAGLCVATGGPDRGPVARHFERPEELLDEPDQAVRGGHEIMGLPGRAKCSTIR